MPYLFIFMPSKSKLRSKKMKKIHILIWTWIVTGCDLLHDAVPSGIAPVYTWRNAYSCISGNKAVQSREGYADFFIKPLPVKIFNTIRKNSRLWKDFICIPAGNMIVFFLCRLSISCQLLRYIKPILLIMLQKIDICSV